MPPTGRPTACTGNIRTGRPVRSRSACWPRSPGPRRKPWRISGGCKALFVNEADRIAVRLILPTKKSPFRGLQKGDSGRGVVQQEKSARMSSFRRFSGDDIFQKVQKTSHFIRNPQFSASENAQSQFSQLCQTFWTSSFRGLCPQ